MGLLDPSTKKLLDQCVRFLDQNSDGTYPARPKTNAAVFYRGTTIPTGGGTKLGGAGAVDNFDSWLRVG